MSYTNLGFGVYHGKKPLSAGFDTFEEAYKALCRIAKTEGYAYEWKDFFHGKWHVSRLPKKWRFLTIKESHDWGGAITSRNEARINRFDIPAEAQPYERKSNIKHLRRPAGFPKAFEKNGEAYAYKEAYIDFERGLTAVYETNSCVYDITKDYADRWQGQGMSRGLFDRIEAENGYTGSL